MIRKLRFFCQRVLPLVYDDSLSYTELLYKVVGKINELIETNDQIVELYKALNAEFDEFKEYINNYFDNLDVTQEINAKIDQLVANGTMAKLLDNIVDDALAPFAALIENLRNSYNELETVTDDLSLAIYRVANETGQNTVDLATTNDRIDNIISGAASGDTEVTDIRNGANGIIYPTAGDAVRGQFLDNQNSIQSNAIDRISSIYTLTPTPITNVYTAGKGLASTGEILERPLRIATVEYINIKGGTRLHYKVNSGYRLYVVTYGVGKEKLRNIGWATSPDNYIDIEQGEVWVRFCIASLDDVSQVTPAQAVNVQIELETEYLDMLGQGLIYRDRVAIGADLNTYNTCGIYNIHNNQLMTNAPEGMTGGVLLVTRGYGSGTAKQYMQIAIDTINKSIWSRYRSGAGVWQAWQKMNGFDYITDIKVDTDLNNITQTGYYNIPNNRVIANAPDLFTGGTLAVMIGYSNTQLIQMLISPFNGNIWVRYRSGAGTWNEWVGMSGFPQIAERTKFLAIGDSITYGVYSYKIDQEEVLTSTTRFSWPKLLAGGLDYDITVMASRGMGYTVTGQDPNGSDLPRINVNELVNRIVALPDDYNLITVAFGINDYNTESSTIQNVITSFTNVISRLANRFPNARIVVITPFNCSRHGDINTNWSFNGSFGGRTLKDIADALQSKCYDLGIECIYASNQFLFNVYNIQELELDNVHPTAQAHRLIAKTLVHTLGF